MRKPDPRAYAEIIAEIGLPAGDLVFVDDNPRYVEGGTASGMRSVLLDVLHPVGAFDAAARLLRLDT